MPGRTAHRMNVNVTELLLLVCPYAIWKLDCSDLYGPAISSSPSGILPIRMSPALCVFTVYDRRKLSPVVTCDGALTVSVCDLTTKNVVRKIKIVKYFFINTPSIFVYQFF